MAIEIKTLATKVREKVITGEYTPGTFLREENLAKVFKVSRTPMRQALTILTNEGLLRKIPNTGCMVRRLSMEEINDIYNIRSVLEGLTARLAAERATKDEIENMRHLAALYGESEKQCFVAATSENWHRVFMVDMDWHRAVAEAAKNKELAKLIEQQHFMRRIMDTTNSVYLMRYSDPMNLGKPNVGHAQIIDAIEQKLPGQAEKLMRLHILRGKHEIIQNLIKQGEMIEEEELIP